jgi:hypothetical protein
LKNGVSPFFNAATAVQNPFKSSASRSSTDDANPAVVVHPQVSAEDARFRIRNGRRGQDDLKVGGVDLGGIVVQAYRLHHTAEKAAPQIGRMR